MHVYIVSMTYHQTGNMISSRVRIIMLYFYNNKILLYITYILYINLILKLWLIIAPRQFFNF